VRYHAPSGDAMLRITIEAETAPALARTVNSGLGVPTP
jgi:hypothetical protein